MVITVAFPGVEAVYVFLELRQTHYIHAWESGHRFADRNEG